MARPPQPTEIVGVWLGFTEDELRFFRLDLRDDHTGFCATVYPSDTTLHEYGVHVYRVTKWQLDGWRLNFTLEPASARAERLLLSGRYGVFTLELQVGGADGQWTRKLVLRRESRLVESSQETKVAIEKADHK